MDFLITYLEYFIVAFLAGIIGALLGVGGGIIIVPALTIIFNLDIHLAIGASIVAVVGTSVASTGTYVKDNLVNMRLGIFLEVATSLGAVIGALLAPKLGKELFILFAIVLIYAAYTMFTSSRIAEHLQIAKKNHKIAEYLHLEGKYINNSGEDPELKPYFVEKVPEIFGVSMGAGLASGLLGVGGGFIKVPALVKVSKIPMKNASATSNFMIGVTAATSAIIYLKNGFVDPLIAVPVAFGTLVGALLGSRIMRRVDATNLRAYFAFLLVIIAIQLFFKGI